MEYILYCLFITPFLLIGLNIIYRRKYNKRIQYEIEKETERYIEKNKQKLEFLAKREIEHLLKTRDDVEIDLKKKIDYLHSVQDSYAKLNLQIEEQQRLIAVYESDQKARIDQRMETYAEERKKEAQKQCEEFMAQLQAQAVKMTEQIQILSNEIEDYTAKQSAINEAIMRQRAIDEQQDFYRVCLAPETANDVSVLNIARQNLKKPEIIDKIIYDNYISKPVLEMVKRVLNNESFSGIYKITCTNTVCKIN